MYRKLLLLIAATFVVLSFVSVGTRVDAQSAKAPPEQRALLIDHLVKNVPEQARAEAVAVPGAARVTIKEWDVPTTGSRPHDPMAASDGSLWWTGMSANKLGRLDLKTGQMREYPVPERSGPHGLTEDKDGNIWYTANLGGYVGKLIRRRAK